MFREPVFVILPKGHYNFQNSFNKTHGHPVVKPLFKKAELGMHLDEYAVPGVGPHSLAGAFPLRDCPVADHIQFTRFS